ncbi:hypothetical protein [Streptomyces avermitilis]|uniref:hypothetical protein n=1 Tax=Streptomyces avermitilis TaxID=33903 RepID=UPI0033F7FEDD
MTVQLRNKGTVRRPETGWAKARRLRGQGIRACERATTDGDAGQMQRLSHGHRPRPRGL